MKEYVVKPIPVEFLIMLYLLESVECMHLPSGSYFHFCHPEFLIMSAWNYPARELEKDLQDSADSLPAEKRLTIFDKIFTAYHEARSSIRSDLVCGRLTLAFLWIVLEFASLLIGSSRLMLPFCLFRSALEMLKMSKMI